MDLSDRAGRPKVGHWAPCEATSLCRACRVGEPLGIAAGFVQSVGGLADSRWIPRAQHTSRGTIVSNNDTIWGCWASKSGVLGNYWGQRLIYDLQSWWRIGNVASFLQVVGDPVWTTSAQHGSEATLHLHIGTQSTF